MFDYRDDLAALNRETYDRVLARDGAVFDQDRDRFEYFAGRAWDWRYLPAVAASYQVRMDRGVAETKDYFRLAEALVALEHHEAALKVFETPMPGFDRSAIYWYRHAEALLGVGKLAEAKKATLRAQTFGPEAKEPARLIVRIERLLKLQAGLTKAPSWGAAAEFVDEALALGAKPSVAWAVGRLAAAPPAADPGQIDQIARTAHAALEVDPKLAHPLIDLVLALEPKGEAISALRIERDLRVGRPEAAEAVAAKRRARAKGRELLYISALAAEATGNRAPAISALGPLSSRFDRDHDIRSSLAKFCGEDVLARVPVKFAAPRSQTGERRRVINLIPFNNEMTMLDTRLREMADWVDLFVIVEAAQSFMGTPKRCGFDEQKADFAEWGDKIRHVKVDAFPDYVDSAWARDCWQRDMAIQALGDGFWAPDDIVLLTDSDEIVQRDAVAGFEIGLIALKMKTYRYFFNYEAQPGNPKNDGHTGVICTADQLAKFGSSYIRFTLSRPNKSWNFIPRAGWHFTSMGDAETLVRKFSSYAHQEKNKKKLKDTGRMGDLLDKIRDGKFEKGWARCEIDASYPAVIRESQDALSELILQP